jgi:hypothetical protein
MGGQLLLLGPQLDHLGGEVYGLLPALFNLQASRLVPTASPQHFSENIDTLIV